MKTKLLIIKLLGLGLVFSSTLFGSVRDVNSPPKASAQSHTLHKDIFARALLQPQGNSNLTGTVEFQAREAETRALISLGNVKAGEHVKVRILDVGACPEGEAGSAKERSGKEIAVLGESKTPGVQAMEKDLKTVRTKDDWTKILSRAVLVEQTPNGPLLACGIIQETD